MTKLAMAVLAFVSLAPAAALAKPAAIERTESFIGQLMKVKPDDGKLTKADRDANQKLFGQIDAFFDFDRLTSDSIAPLAGKFKPEERAEFLKKLRELIRLIAYPDSGAWFKKAQYQLLDPKETQDRATVTVDAKIPKDDLETKVDLHWQKSKEGLRLIDVSFDGDSLVKDYQNQFARIVEKEGVKGLLSRVDKRRAELEAPPKGK